MLSLLVLLVCFLSGDLVILPTKVIIKLDKVMHKISDKFVGVTFDTGLVRRHWDNFNTRSKSVQTLSKALSPSYLRVGGTDADFLLFQDQEKCSEWQPHVFKNKTRFNMSAQFLDELYDFAVAVNWDLIFDLNSLLRYKNGSWDPTNAVKLFYYVTHKSYTISGWELGNEPDQYPSFSSTPVKPEQLAKDYGHLVQIIKSFPPFKNSIIIGPSVAQLIAPSTLDYFTRFFLAGGGQYITAATFHQYYTEGSTTHVEQFLDPKVLDVLIQQIIEGQFVVKTLAAGKQVWLGETSSSWNGGAPNISDRYVAGFVWLDKLGLSAALGIDAVIRQDFYGGNYGLINYKDLSPNPDYWLTLLYKNLVGNAVFSTSFDNIGGRVRAYSHCTNTKRSHYQPGSVTVYVLNLNNQTTLNMTFPQFPDAELDVFLLEPVPTNDITSRKVSLNGQVLALKDEEHLPNLLPQKQMGSFNLPPLTFAFVVIPTSNVSICYT